MSVAARPLTPQEGKDAVEAGFEAVKHVSWCINLVEQNRRVTPELLASVHPKLRHFVVEAIIKRSIAQ